MEINIEFMGYEIPVSIRKATVSDIFDLIELNQKWQKRFLTHDLSHGFLSSQFTNDEFCKIIEESDAVVAQAEFGILGYYLVNRHSKDGIFSIHEKIVKKLQLQGIIKADCIVGIGVQATIEKDFQGLGIRQKMLNALIEQVRHKYDILFSNVSKLNVRAITADLKDGWKILSEDEHQYWVAHSMSEVNQS